MSLTPEIILRVMPAPKDAVTSTWPLVLAALQDQGIGSLAVQCAAAAMIQVECPAWVPVEEMRASRDRQPKLWALQERYWPSGYYGRGLIQLTHLDNYRAAGLALGLDLVEHPDLALAPGYAAKILAWFMKANRVAEAASLGKLIKARTRVNGGNGIDVSVPGGTTHALDKFIEFNQRLLIG